MSDLEEFIEAYARSYETYDPARVAEFIHCPCMFFLRDACVLLETDAKVSEFMRAGLENYRANDCIHFNAQLLQQRRIGPRFALIDVEWTTRNADGETTMNFTTTYNLVSVGARWKVSMITRHDE